MKSILNFSFGFDIGLNPELTTRLGSISPSQSGGTCFPTIRTPIGRMIFQRHDILNLFYKFGMTECKLVSTPLDQNLKLDVDSGTKECEPTHYRQLIDG